MKAEVSFYLRDNMERGTFLENNWLQILTMQLRREASF